jgi:hypothetical protein
MFRNIRKNIEKKIRAASVHELREGLIVNLSMDLNYENFPQLPERNAKRHHEIGGYDVLYQEREFFNAMGQTGFRFSLRIKKNGAFLGALLVNNQGSDFNLILPDDRGVVEEIDTLFAALAEISLADKISREGSVAA